MKSVVFEKFYKRIFAPKCTKTIRVEVKIILPAGSEDLTPHCIYWLTHSDQPRIPRTQSGSFQPCERMFSVRFSKSFYWSYTWCTGVTFELNCSQRIIIRGFSRVTQSTHLNCEWSLVYFTICSCSWVCGNSIIVASITLHRQWSNSHTMKNETAN